jgi:hypothetical protein
MIKEFSKITIEYENGTISLVPEKYYYIEEHKTKHVVMYKLKLVNKDISVPIIECNIPYYISNGLTNKLRANMLYPFMCYSNKIQSHICPHNFMERIVRMPEKSLLLKYNNFVNLNLNELEQKLLHIFFEMFPDLEDEQKDLNTKIVNEENHSNNDLISVMYRIQNILDFIICISSHVIQNFNYNQDKNEIDLGKYRPFSQEQLTHNLDYTDMTIFGQETIYVADGVFEDSSSPFNNHFRSVILTILNKYYKSFINNHIIDIELLSLSKENINVNQFNRIVYICDKKHSKINIKNYYIISNFIVDIINKKIDLDLSISEDDRILLKSILIIIPNTNIDEDEIYDNSLSNWGVKCYV